MAWDLDWIFLYWVSLCHSDWEEWCCGAVCAVNPCVNVCVRVCVRVCVCTCGYMLCACVSACVDYISPWSKQCSGTAPDGYSNGIRVYTHTHTHTHTHVEIHTQAAAAWRTWAARAGARGAGKIRREHEAGIHEGWVQVVFQMFLHKKLYTTKYIKKMKQACMRGAYKVVIHISYCLIYI